HAPAQHADAVDHRGVAVGAEDGVREGPGLAVDLALHDHPRQVLQVHLVHDAGVGRHHLEVLEGVLAPAQEAVAFAVALELDAPVQVERVGAPEHIHLDRVVDHQLRGDLGVDLLRAATQAGDGVAHGGQVDHAGHAGEVLQHHARGHERDLGVRLGPRIPARHRLDVLAAHGHPAVLVPEQVLQQDLHGAGEVGQVEVATEPRQAGAGVGPPVDLQAVAGGERIGPGGGSWWGQGVAGTLAQSTGPGARGAWPPIQYAALGM